MMFFGCKNKKIKKKGIVLQTRRKKNSSFLINSKIDIRRISSAVSLRRKKENHFYDTVSKASLTIEAAVALPIFLLCCIMILSLVDMINSYVKAEEKLYEQTRSACVYAGLGEKALGTGGPDYVEFYVPHVISPKLKGPGYQSFLSVNHCKAHIWNGYHGEQIQEDESDTQYVYLTQSGRVYHKKRDCSHLNITIEQVTFKKISGERNNDGSKYYGCPVCVKKMTEKELQNSTLFITPYGNRYHISCSCYELKRTVRVVPLSQVGTRRVCSECGG